MVKKHVFLSYCHDNKAEVAQLRDDLVASGEAVWWDGELLPGQDWKQQIRRAMKASYAVVLCLSQELEARIQSGVYPEVLDAITAYRQQSPGSIFLIPIRLSACETPDIEIDDTRMLERLQTVDLFPPDKWNDGLQLLLKALQATPGRPADSAGVASVGTTTKAALAPHVYLAKLPTTAGDLFGRDKQLARLDQAWGDAHTRVFMLSAWGGVGKTALVKHWLNGVEQENYRGAARVYGWSFYSQGTSEDRQASADEFLAHAFEWFLETENLSPAQRAARLQEFTPKAPWDKGVELAGLIRRRRTLLILDGLEPLQHPPGEMRGRLRDQGVGSLLQELARAGADWGLCVLTTRLPVPELVEMKRASVQDVRLENLADEAGVQLLRSLGVQGTDRELTEAVGEFKGHALALTLLGSYLAVVHDGEIRQRNLVPALDDEEAQGGHARRVMHSYALWLKGKPELDILHLLGLFDRPADGGALRALRQEPAIDGLTGALRGLTEKSWKYAVQHLRDLRLLEPRDDARPDTLDSHPLVREHFGAVLQARQPAAWQEGHNRLYEYYKNLPAKQQPDTLVEMEPLFHAVAHGCHAGRHQETLMEVFWERISRGDEAYSIKKLGAFGADLAALSGFFEAPWSQPASGLTDKWKAEVLNWAGYGLRALGRLREAREPLQAGMQASVEQEDWQGAAIDAGNLRELLLALGDVTAAVAYGRQSVGFADRSGDAFQRESKRTALADALHQAGEMAEAEILFQEAEGMQQERRPQYRFLYAPQGYQFCDLLLSQGQFQQVLERASQALELAKQHSNLLSIALSNLSLGRAVLLQAQVEGPDAFLEAVHYLDQAVQGLRDAGRQDQLPRGLLTRAELHRARGDWNAAWRDLAEAQEIAERGEMKLHLADFHLEAARLCHAVAQAAGQAAPAPAIEEFLRALPGAASVEQGNLSAADIALARAREHLASARPMIEQMGYGRRQPEMAELEQLLAPSGENRSQV